MGETERRGPLGRRRHRLATTGIGAGVVSVALLGAPNAARAKAAPDSPASDVILTALKREATAQSLPLSITAVSGGAIKASGVEDVAALTAVPGLAISNAGPSNTRVIIRGVQAVGEATVGVYYDETPVTGMVGATNDVGGNTPALKLFDVSRVEVLRGPQGTLYGSGAMSGTLRVIFNKPTPALEGAVDGSFSGTDRGTGELLQGMINRPLVQGRLAIRAVAFNENSSGFINNTFLHLKDVDSQRVQGGRLLARLWATDKLTVVLGQTAAISSSLPMNSPARCTSTLRRSNSRPRNGFSTPSHSSRRWSGES